MQHRVIINARAKLRWQQRFFSDASTAALWGFWLWLCRPGLGVAEWLLGARLGLPQFATTMMASGPPRSVEGTALALLSTSGALLLWNHWGVRQKPRLREVTLPDFADRFGLSVQDIQHARDSGRCVVQHDAQGRIVSIDAG